MNKIKYTVFLFVLVLLINGLTLFNKNQSTPSVSSASSSNSVDTESAKEAVVRFFHAQKLGDVNGMIRNSKYAVPINNLREVYSSLCKKQPLVNAIITDIKVIDDTLAFVSYESRYKDKILITTSPVYKEKNEWKLVTGIPSVLDIRPLNTSRLDEPIQSAKQAVKNYIEAREEGNIDEMAKYRRDVLFSNTAELKKYLSKKEDFFSEGKIRGIAVVGNNLVLVSTENKSASATMTETLPVYKDKDGWKIIFGRSLAEKAIPIGDNLVEIN
ncbi:hypothetical protein [Aneurinibacillus tyrosinisolvens]|uniref:hypothetical protein n=1 Tax=Aneurinibacillus tyrosinisolvens TaxID=1443435 RepID=UPI00063F96F9|nr:hypothetical protein [Aneurinibacillus tyrosinisolvens]